MNLEKTIKALKVAWLLREMPVGEGWFTPVTLAQFSGLSHSSVYRYLPRLVELGHVEFQTYECRKLKCRKYRITTLGRELLQSQKEMPF